MGTLGERLRHARIRAGLSLAEISARTKIRTALLEAIEREDFRSLPNGILGRGYLRAFAREVGLDAEPVVQDFRDETDSPTPRPAGALPSALVELADADGRDLRGPWRVFAVTAVLAALLGAVLMLVTLDPAATDPVDSLPFAADDRGADAAAENREGIHESGAPAGDVVAAVDTPDVYSLTVAISAASVVWVEATADGTRVLYELLHPGDARVVQARDEILFLVGDAAAFQYWVNSVPGRQMGGPGAVSTFRITRENYRSFQDE